MRNPVIDSYDPHVWARSWSPPDVPVSMADRSAHWRIVPLGLAAGVLALGGVAAWLSRPPAPSPGAVAQGAGAAVPARNTQVRRTLVLSGAADLRGALQSAGLSAEVAGAVAAAAAPALPKQGEIRAILTLDTAAGAPQLRRLEVSNADSSGVIVNRSAEGRITTAAVARQLQTRIVVRHGTMDGDSFYSSAIAAGIPNDLIPRIAKALAFDFDFQREVAAGDAFEAAYAQPVNASGDGVGAPTLLYASLTTGAKSAAVYRFDVDGKTESWFDASGRSTARALMRTPVDGARVSSSFGMRLHPILGFMKLHGGIDFAAPTGTPIYASGNGTIEWAAMKGPNGNLVILRHDNGWETYYLHLNRFAAGIAAGVRVSQGQQIGEVGTTGRSTGPHLHYEVHINGEKVDPLSVRSNETGQTLSGDALLRFEKLRDQIDVSRAGQSG
jgi:murein DD-endopeptidase MepM/ murein hydrolase activator NlpD